MRIRGGIGLLGLLLAVTAPGLAAQPKSMGCAVLFVPGAFGAQGTARFLRTEDYFSEYRRFFEGHGCVVRKVEFPADVGIEVSSRVLRDQAERFITANPGAEITLVAHSQGALDTRYALRTLRLQHVHNVISVGAPHQGTPVADWVIRQRDDKSLLYWAFRLIGRYDFRALRFAGELTKGFLDAHSTAFEEVPSVRYASARSVCRTHCYWALRLVSWWIGIGEGDGMIPESSQRFGEDLGSYDLDHLSEMGADDEKRAEREKLMARMWDFILEGRRPSVAGH